MLHEGGHALFLAFSLKCWGGRIGIKIKTKWKQQQPLSTDKGGLRKKKRSTLRLSRIYVIWPYSSRGFFMPAMSVSFYQTHRPISPFASGWKSTQTWSPCKPPSASSIFPHFSKTHLLFLLLVASSESNSGPPVCFCNRFGSPQLTFLKGAEGVIVYFHSTWTLSLKMNARNSEFFAHVWPEHIVLIH